MQMSTHVGNTLVIQPDLAPRVSRPNRVATSLVHVAGDILAWAAAASVAAWVANTSGQPAVTEQLLLTTLAVMLTLAAYTHAGLYPAAGIDHVEELRRLTLRTTGVWLPLTAAVAIGLRADAVYPWLSAWAVALVAVPTTRSLLRQLCADRPWYGVPVVILGPRPAAASLLRRLEHLAGGMHRPVAVTEDDSALEPLSGTGSAGMSLHRVLVLRAPVAAAPMGPSAMGSGTALRHHAQGVWVHRSQLLLKRGLDLAIAVPAALVAAPVVLAAAAAVWIVSPGNPFFTHEREGLGGRTFRMWKLRSMYRDAGERLERHLATHPEAAEEWASRFKLAHDPRVLPVIGRFLRVTSLDELPQLWNILRGDMSLVGPRPFPAYHLDAFSPEFRSLRHSVQPGLTGLWQITARADADLALQEELDTMYVDSWSVWLDLYLLARTPWAVLRGGGAY